MLPKINSNGLKLHRSSFGVWCSVDTTVDRRGSVRVGTKTETRSAMNGLITKLVLVQMLAGSSEAARRGKCCAVRCEYCLPWRRSIHIRDMVCRSDFKTGIAQRRYQKSKIAESVCERFCGNFDAEEREGITAVGGAMHAVITHSFVAQGRLI